MDIWVKYVKQYSHGAQKLRKLVKIGTTRWWSNYKAVKRICDEPLSYFILLKVLWHLSTHPGTPQTKSSSEDLLNNWLKFANLLTANNLRIVIKSCDPVTKYLQTKGLDIIQAMNLVNCQLKLIKEGRCKFAEVLKSAHEFRDNVQK